MIAAAMFITAPRKEVVDFSDPIYTYGEGLVVPKSDTKAYATQDDLKGETVGAQVGTAFVDALKKSGLFADVKAYDTIPDILRDTVGSVGIGVRKGEAALLGKINASLAKLKANGTIDKILEKWGQKAQG